MERISWDQYFMAQSRLLALRSTCTRLMVGATIVRDKRIIAGGYITEVCRAVSIARTRAVMSLTATVYERSMPKPMPCCSVPSLACRQKVQIFMSPISHVCNAASR